MKDQPTTVAQYLAALPAERRRTALAVRRLVKRHLPAGYKEGIGWGAITYSVPLATYPDTYNGQPTCYVAIAAQRQKVSLHLMGAAADPRLRKKLEAGFRRAGKRLDMGMGCLRFRTLDDLHVETIGEVIAAVPMRAYIALVKKGLPWRR